MLLNWNGGYFVFPVLLLVKKLSGDIAGNFKSFTERAALSDKTLDFIRSC